MRWFLILLALWSFSCNAESSEKQRVGEPIYYTKAIREINLVSGELHSTSFVFASELFIILFENPLPYLDSAINFLSKENVSAKEDSHNQKMIAILTMQKLSDKDYLQFVNKCANLFEQGKLSEFLVSLAISPAVNWNHSLLKNYEEKEVVSVLKRIRDKAATPDLKNMINDILSGKRWKEMDKFMKDYPGYHDNYLDREFLLKLKSQF